MTARIGSQTARDLASCGNCGHARMDHELLSRVFAEKARVLRRGHCQEDNCPCPRFEQWKEEKPQ